MIGELKGNETNDLWVQFMLIDPFLHYGQVGLDFEQFSEMISGTFSAWSPCPELVERLFIIADTKKDGFVDFRELFSLFSGKNNHNS